MKPLNVIAALATTAIIFAAVAVSFFRLEKPAAIRVVMPPPIRTAPPVEAPDNEPTMLTIEQPDGFEWQAGDDELLDDHGRQAEILYSEPRSSCWKKTRADYLRDHPCCEFKGCKERKNLQAHHCVPFHVNPARECDPTNIIAACWNHHIWGAHQGNFKEHDRHVRANFAAGRYTIIGWERMQANRMKHKRLRERGERIRMPLQAVETSPSLFDSRHPLIVILSFNEA